MSDLEIEAMAAIATALAELEEEARGRVLKWAADRYGVTLESRTGPMASPGGGSNGGGVASSDQAATVDEAAVMAAVAEETGVPGEKLERVFHIDGDVVKLLGPSSQYGANTTDQARAVAQVVTVVRRVGMGHSDTSFEILKEACESKHCYDSKHFASEHMKSVEGFVIKGERKNRRLEAKGAGISAFPSLIDSILAES